MIQRLEMQQQLVQRTINGMASTYAKSKPIRCLLSHDTGDVWRQKEVRLQRQQSTCLRAVDKGVAGSSAALEDALFLATKLRRCELRNQEGVVVLAKVDLALHLGKAWHGRKGEGGALDDVDVSTNVVEGGQVDAGEHAVVVDVEVPVDVRERGEVEANELVVFSNVNVSLRMRQPGVDQGDGRRPLDGAVPDDDRAD
jgi:hypothetical protein